MEQILPALERELRLFRRNAAWLAGQHPRLAGQLGGPAGMPDPHVNRLVQGVAALHARTALMAQRGVQQLDEHLLDAWFPDQLRPFPPCRIVASPAPLAVIAARFELAPEPSIMLDLEASAGTGPVPVFLDGDAAFCAALREALLTGRAQLQEHGGEWRPLAAPPFAATGLDPGDALLPRSPGAHAGLALLREFFAFPTRFNVLRLAVPAAGRCALRLVLPARWRDAATARPLLALDARRLRPGWSARAMLSPQAAAPILIDGRTSEYILSVPSGLEVFSVDRASIRFGGNVVACRPVFAEGEDGPRWIARRAAGAAPCHAWRIAFAGAPAEARGGVASFDLTCCPREGLLGAPARGGGSRWQLDALLAQGGRPLDAAVLRELMATQLPVDFPAAQNMIAAVQRLEPRTCWLRIGRAAPLAGTELRLHIDDACFAGCGMLLFAQVMDRFFGESARLNTFTRLILLSARTGEELMRCKARNAGTVLE